jgi:hypothetical protein
MMVMQVNQADRQSVLIAALVASLKASDTLASAQC